MFYAIQQLMNNMAGLLQQIR